jgi:8-amino-7-oxononanoate synthase
VLPSLSHQIAADLQALQSLSRLRTCPNLAGASRVQLNLDGRPVISFCSNDYLGLACDPRLQAAASEAAANSGFGASASRLVAGNHPEHIALEHALASFLFQPAALLFPTGYQANLGVLTALAGPDDLIVADRAVHASILDGCRLSRAKLAIYPHLDALAAERHLTRLGPTKRRRFLVTESLFSMDGDVAPLDSLSAIASAHDAALVVDEAHAFGSLGPAGRGLCAQFGIHPDVFIGTLGKALGASGAFVAGTSDLRAYLLNHARGFIFTTGLPVPVAAAAHAALRILSSPEGDGLRHRLSHLTTLLRSHLTLPTPSISSPILPFTVGSDQLAVDASLHLLDRGFFVQAIRPPTVKEGTSRLRITLSSRHTEQQVAALAEAIASYPSPHIAAPPPTFPFPRLCPSIFRDLPPPPSLADPIRGLFLLGTDTGVGKTTVAVALLHILASRGIPAVPFKPVETGATPLPADAVRLLAASKRLDIPLAVVCPLAFPQPIAPAAASHDSPFTLPDLLAHAHQAASHGGPLIVESAGGLLTPYATNFATVDLAAALGLPVVLIARNALGTVNHTALAVAELRRRELPLLGIILVTTVPVPTPDHNSNLALIAEVTGLAPLGILPFVHSQTPADLAAELTANVDLRPIFDVLPI